MLKTGKTLVLGENTWTHVDFMTPFENTDVEIAVIATDQTEGRLDYVKIRVGDIDANGFKVLIQDNNIDGNSGKFI